MNSAFDARMPRGQAGPAPTRKAGGDPLSAFPAGQSTMQHDSRKEPSFSGTAPGAGAAESQLPPYAGSAYAQFEQQAPWYQQTGPLHRNPVSRIVLMTGIFVVGAAVGLAATWWMSKPVDTQAPTPAVSRLEPGNQAPASNAARAAIAVPEPGTGEDPFGGISRGELPYDGNPPATGMEPAAPAADAAPAKENTEPPKATEPAQTADKAAQSADKAKPEEAAPPVASVPPPAPKKVQPQDKAAAETPAGGVTKPAIPRPKARETKVAKAPQRQSGAEKAAKDREIERIQQQADDELKKKSRDSDVTGSSRDRTEETEKRAVRQANGAASSASQGSKRAALARCEREEDSLIGREWCKWKVCKGMWGKNGCPSYDPPHANSQF